MSHDVSRARAFAPASVANVACGFDILGFSFAALGDTVTVEWDSKKPYSLKLNSANTPQAIEKNTASVAIQSMIRAQNLKGSFTLTLEKGIPLSSGLGGSAASSVAAVVALNALLLKPLPTTDLLRHALAGEFVASNGYHMDNLLPSLIGGLTAAWDTNELLFSQLPLPQVFALVVHPDMKIETREARARLSPTVDLKKMIAQMSKLGAFIENTHAPSSSLIKFALEDLVIEPQRQDMIPGFPRMKTAAFRHGAIGFSISGAGPSLFGWFLTEASAIAAALEITSAFTDEGLKSQYWIRKLDAEGAKILELSHS